MAAGDGAGLQAAIGMTLVVTIHRRGIALLFRVVMSVDGARVAGAAGAGRDHETCKSGSLKEEHRQQTEKGSPFAKSRIGVLAVHPGGVERYSIYTTPRAVLSGGIECQ